MAEPPVLFKRTKPKHTQRSRISTPDPTTGEEAEAQDSPSAVAAKLRKKTRAKAKSTLSFGGDEEVRCPSSVALVASDGCACAQEGEEEVFKLKKSSLSKKLQLGKSSIGCARHSCGSPLCSATMYVSTLRYVNTVQIRNKKSYCSVLMYMEA